MLDPNLVPLILLGCSALVFTGVVLAWNNRKAVKTDVLEAHKNKHESDAKAGITPDTGYLIALGVALGIFFISAMFHSGAIVGIIVGPVVGLFLGLNLFSQACPECKRLLVDKELGSETIESRTGYKTVTRTEENSNGDTIRRWQEQIRVKTVKYHEHHECQNCGARWFIKREKELETFDD
jgi:hypothetical protein